MAKRPSPLPPAHSCCPSATLPRAILVSWCWTLVIVKCSRWLSRRRAAEQRTAPGSRGSTSRVHLVRAGLVARVRLHGALALTWTKTPGKSSEKSWSSRSRCISSWSLRSRVGGSVWRRRAASLRIFQRATHSLNSPTPWASTHWTPNRHELCFSNCLHKRNSSEVRPFGGGRYVHNEEGGGSASPAILCGNAPRLHSGLPRPVCAIAATTQALEQRRRLASRRAKKNTTSQRHVQCEAANRFARCSGHGAGRVAVGLQKKTTRVRLAAAAYARDFITKPLPTRHPHSHFIIYHSSVCMSATFHDLLSPYLLFFFPLILLGNTKRAHTVEGHRVGERGAGGPDPFRRCFPRRRNKNSAPVICFCFRRPHNVRRHSGALLAASHFRFHIFSFTLWSSFIWNSFLEFIDEFSQFYSTP